ncbi:glycosyltransferase [Leptolyngbya sp. 7M]|uniref:glycosyltransferase n=1 Tax=Leptolyngbya sp. 7M TaxID=2812896 RepID=UPI001B8C4D9D|nr:glycosyltransferase [Leptolyngbya sp. 7M]QYO64430.1 glycosyltransferase [Leptolyngbya sp. 7M]
MSAQPLSQDTIAAIATAIVPQQGSVGIVRLSGPDSISIARILFYAPGRQTWESHRILYGYVRHPQTEQIIDEALLLLMLAPRSYTREDVVEFHCHGGIMAVQQVLSLCLEQGARLAQPGEFTLRAFLNGRLDLTQAESIADLVGAESPQAAQTALAGLQGKLAHPIRQLRATCLDILAEVEARIDFEDDLPPLDDHNAVIADRVDVCIPSRPLLAATLRSYFSVLSLEVSTSLSYIASETIHQFISSLSQIEQRLNQLLLELKQTDGLTHSNGAVSAPGANVALRSATLKPVTDEDEKLSPPHSSVYTKLGDAYAAAQNLEAAIAAYNTALKFAPHTVDIRAKLNQTAVVYEMSTQAKENQSVKPWPYGADPRPIPPTLPNGQPWPKISIITPSFNQGEYIEETILSVIHQNYPNVEHILIDGGSTDNTMQVVNQYRDHFSYVISEPDQGQSNALNKGFQQATGEILTWLNSDDRLAPNALYAMALAFYTSGADVVAGVCQLFRDGIEIEQHLTSCVDGLLPLGDLLDLDRCWLKGKFFYQPEVMFTRSIWERSGGYVDESLFYSMDYELWTRFAAQGARLYVIGHPIAQYRMHAAQKTSEVDKYEPELRQTCEALRHRFDCAPTLQAWSQIMSCCNSRIVPLGEACDTQSRPDFLQSMSEDGEYGSTSITQSVSIVHSSSLLIKYILPTIRALALPRPRTDISVNS